MRNAPSLRLQHAFSLVEVLTTVAVLGILAAIAVQIVGGLETNVRQTKLESDVQTLNAAVKVYLANGGSLNGITGAAEVIAKMKTVRSRESDTRYVGFSGAMVDGRLFPVFQTEEMAASGRPRARWNASKLAFEISHSGPDGISHFAWDAASAAQDFGEEERAAGSVSYNAEDGWVWAFRDSPATGPVSPGVVPLTPAGPSPLPGPRTEPQRLAPPQFSTPPGTYTYPDFPSVVSIANPNPAGSSTIHVATVWDDAGIQWQPYTGPVAVEPGMQILAFARHASASYSDSFSVGGLFVRNIYPLRAPEIETSAPYLNLESNEVVTVELIDTNPDFAAHRLEYSINGGDFIAYSGPLSISPSSYATGFAVVARSAPTSDGFTRSPEVSQAMNLKLGMPAIDVAAPPADGQATTIPVTLGNPNPGGSSVILYALRDEATGATTTFREYETPVQVVQADYPDGFTVIAYASPVTDGYLPSDEATSFGITFFGIPVTGSTVFVLDRSGSMAWDDGIGQVKAEMNRVLDLLERDDHFGIIKFSTAAEVVMPWTDASRQKVRTAKTRVNNLTPEGWTNYSAALSLALDAARHYKVKQVVFLSDGAPTAGDTRPGSILSLVSQIVAQGTRVDTLAFGRITEEGRALLEQMDAAGNL